MSINFISLLSLFLLLFKLSHPLLKYLKPSASCWLDFPATAHQTLPDGQGRSRGQLRVFAWVVRFPWNPLRHLSSKSWAFSWNRQVPVRGSQSWLQCQGVPGRAGQVGPGPSTPPQSVILLSTPILTRPIAAPANLMSWDFRSRLPLLCSAAVTVAEKPRWQTVGQHLLKFIQRNCSPPKRELPAVFHWLQRQPKQWLQCTAARETSQGAAGLSHVGCRERALNSSSLLSLRCAKIIFPGKGVDPASEATQPGYTGLSHSTQCP